MLPTLMGINKSLNSLEDNPANPKTHASNDLIKEIMLLASFRFASSIGFTYLPHVKNLINQLGWHRLQGGIGFECVRN